MGKCTSFVAILNLPSTPLLGCFVSFLLFCRHFFVTHVRCEVTGYLRQLVPGEVGGGGVHKKVLCGEAPRRTPLTFIYNF